MIHSPDSFRPFDLAGDADYRVWRAWKLDGYPVAAADLLVDVDNPAHLTAAEHAAILARCRKANMAIYAVRGGGSEDKEAVRALGRQFGLERLDMNLRADEDSITALRVVPETAGTRYIPYTNRPLNWHTDGYYNTLDEQVRAILMHCVSAAASGGESVLFDHELAYLLLRDENPAYIRALLQPDAMTIPANIEDGRQIRGAQSGPVFTVEKGSNALHMRYTARTRSIEWKDDRDVRNAIEFLRELLDSDLPWIFRHRLQAGQGIICNNVLHRREAFDDAAADGQARLLYRARYHDRIRATVADNDFYGDRQCCG
ncbi:MAG: TauD/TfdA family dioxygenase [Gammaproteobacteria bacterium]